MTQVPLVCALAILLIVYWDQLATGSAATPLAIGSLTLAAVVAVTTARSCHDLLNPLTVVLGLCLLRIGLPAFLLLAGSAPSSEFLVGYSISREDLLRGEGIAAAGVLGVVLGWYACPVTPAGRVFERIHRFAGRIRNDPRIMPAAVVVFGAGLLAMVMYLTVNFGDPLSAAASGVARGNTAPGTSRYGFAAVGLLTASATILVLHLGLRPEMSRIVVFAPAFAAMTVLTVLGGRTIAITPVVLAAVGVHYLRGWESPRKRSRPVRRRGAAMIVGASLAVLLIGYGAFVPQYRGGAGVSALSQAFSAEGLREYANFAIWTEFGMIQNYALADELGAGALQGATYPGVLGLTGSLLGLEGEVVGSALVDPFRTGGSWGVFTGLVPDVFVNSGLTLALVAAVLFGAVLRAEYVGFRRSGPTLGATLLHLLVLWTMIGVYFESILVAPSQFEITLPSLLLIVLVASIFPQRLRA